MSDVAGEVKKCQLRMSTCQRTHKQPVFLTKTEEEIEYFPPTSSSYRMMVWMVNRGSDSSLSVTCIARAVGSSIT